jgi:hypothetical protein
LSGLPTNQELSLDSCSSKLVPPQLPPLASWRFNRSELRFADEYRRNDKVLRLRNRELPPFVDVLFGKNSHLRSSFRSQYVAVFDRLRRPHLHLHCPFASASYVPDIRPIDVVQEFIETLHIEFVRRIQERDQTRNLEPQLAALLQEIRRYDSMFQIALDFRA